MAVHVWSQPSSRLKYFGYAIILLHIFAIFPKHLANERKEQTCVACQHDPNLIHFPDRPLQLVKPDKEHKSLVISKENVALLQKIPGPVAVVGVVGKFHSGKSFLMNQLMGKSGGFGIGPSVQPQTMGIWMWGRPWLMEMSSGQKISVVFLDTEGFAANNVSENYDAKIFAVTTLLSSYLLYNSVKIIDQADIDYLELLARRTQLFALRSQISRSKWTDDFIHDLLTFPPLLWIVQDFVQTTVEEETAQKWLHRLMETHTRENEDYEISLLGIFKSVDCHTLFLPATRKIFLTDLSLATEEDLTLEYKEEREQLLAKLRKEILPKEKNNKPITGVELASLFEILVTASNEGSLSDIPNRWNAFIERLKQTATEDCLKYYNAEMTVIHDKHDNGPIKAQELKEWHEQSYGKSVKLLLQLLFGLEDALGEAKTKLRQDVLSQFERVNELNEKKIKLRCSELQNRMELNAEDAMKSLALPCPSMQLKDHVESVITQIKTEFLVELGDLIEPKARDKYITLLKNMILNLGRALELNNNKAIEIKLQDAVSLSLGKFKLSTKQMENTPHIPTQLQKIIKDTTLIALQMFEKNSIKFKEENLYIPYLSVLKAEIADHAKEVEKRNEELVQTMIETKVLELKRKFEISTSMSHISLPMNATDLESRLIAEITRIEREYKVTLEDYVSYEAYHNGLKNLEQLLSVITDQRRQENVEAFTREVERPLHQAKQIIMLSADKYSTKFSLKNFMKTICLLNLDDGKPKYWSKELKAEIIEHFLQSNDDLRTLLEKRTGFWSSIFGFFQWILWLLNIT